MKLRDNATDGDVSTSSSSDIHEFNMVEVPVFGVTRFLFLFGGGGGVCLFAICFFAVVVVVVLGVFVFCWCCF